VWSEEQVRDAYRELTAEPARSGGGSVFLVCAALAILLILRDVADAGGQDID
jgi:hypothetical protein